MPFRYLWVFFIAYVSILMMANWYDARIVSLFGIDTDAGTLIFPLSFLCADIITEVYGYKRARAAIWTAFVINLIYLGYGLLVTHMPTPDFAKNSNAAFDAIMSMNIWIVIASIISYLCGEPLNAALVAKLKVLFDGSFMPVRFFFSTFIAAFIDSLMFSFIAFLHIFSVSDILKLALSMWLIKVAIELIGLPISVTLAKKLKRLERTDIYDNNTRFNLFSTDTQYQQKDNHYQR